MMSSVWGHQVPKLTEEDIMEVKQVNDVSHVITTNNTMETMDINDKNQ